MGLGGCVRAGVGVGTGVVVGLGGCVAAGVGVGTAVAVGLGGCVGTGVGVGLGADGVGCMVVVGMGRGVAVGAKVDVAVAALRVETADCCPRSGAPACAVGVGDGVGWATGVDVGAYPFVRPTSRSRIGALSESVYASVTASAVVVAGSGGRRGVITRPRTAPTQRPTTMPTTDWIDFESTAGGSRGTRGSVVGYPYLCRTAPRGDGARGYRRDPQNAQLHRATTRHLRD